jgi:2-keto-4-pentenoate hydratase
VADASIHQARTPEQVLQHLDQVIPAIELPDLVVEAPPELNGAGVAAINAGARLFAMGTPIAVQRTPAFSVALRDMVAVVKVDGAEIDRGKGSDGLEHPLNAVVWLAQDLQRHGITLKKGDLLSVGSFSKPTPPKPGQKVEVPYQGPTGNPVIGVSFR